MEVVIETVFNVRYNRISCGAMVMVTADPLFMLMTLGLVLRSWPLPLGHKQYNDNYRQAGWSRQVADTKI